MNHTYSPALVILLILLAAVATGFVALVRITFALAALGWVL